MTLTDSLRQFQLHADQLLVWVFAPYIETEEGLYSEHYGKPVTKAELAAAFSVLCLEWRWQPITMANLRQVAGEVLASGEGSKIPVVLNYCDGDELDGYPGLTVVRTLEEMGIIFTGANSSFYELTTSKITMKGALCRQGVSTAPYAVINDHEVSGICERLGTPLLVKPAVSAGSHGLSLKSVVHNDEELGAQVKYLLRNPFDWDIAAGGIFVERFVSGPEFTVLVVGSPGSGKRRVYPPLERVFNKLLPEEERFFSFDRYWGYFQEEAPLPPGEYFYEMRLADRSLWDRLSDISWRAFCAVGGTGYARVDLRMDSRTGEIFVLEVNSNCGISSPEDDSSVGRILEHADLPFEGLIAEILTDALLRHPARVTLPIFSK